MAITTIVCWKQMEGEPISKCANPTIALVQLALLLLGILGSTEVLDLSNVTRSASEMSACFYMMGGIFSILDLYICYLIRTGQPRIVARHPRTENGHHLPTTYVAIFQGKVVPIYTLAQLGTPARSALFSLEIPPTQSSVRCREPDGTVLEHYFNFAADPRPYERNIDLHGQE